MVQGDEEVQDDDDDLDELEEPPASLWATVSEITGGVVALFLVAAGVLALYVAGGVFLGFLTWAAPAFLAIAGAFVLARYLSRTR